MFNMYQTLNKKDDDGGDNSCGRRRESDVTGHDRFYQERPPRSRRKKRSVDRRSKSAVEFDTTAMITARNLYAQKKRSASIESGVSIHDNNSNNNFDERFRLTNKIDSLTKLLFNRVSVAKTYRDNGMRRAWNTSSNCHHETRNSCIDCLIRFCQRIKLISSRLLDVNECYNKYSRNDCRSYESLDQNAFRDDNGEYLELENRSKDHRRSICDVYIRKSARYNLIKQLHDVGSRVDKYWLVVRDTLFKTNRLLTLMPLNKTGPLNINPTTKDVLNKLFLALQHPYICPVLDIEFIEFDNVYHVILVQPISHGSLKDLIYGVARTSWNVHWELKYASRGRGLPIAQIQQMARQILEALVFLKERGFPTVTHLHSGNVVIQDGVARLTGLENSLLGFNSRIYPIITSRLANNNSIDSICFGHMLFEMCAGYELRSFKPSEIDYEDIAEYPQVVDLLNLIFNQSNGCYPTIKELIVQDLFRNIELREMRYSPVDMFRPVLTPSIVSLLECIKKHTNTKK